MIELPNSFNEAGVLIQAGFLVWYAGYLGKDAPNFFDLDPNTQEAYYYRYKKCMRATLEELRERQGLATEESCLGLIFFNSLSVRTKNALAKANELNLTENYANPAWLAQQEDNVLLAVHQLGRKGVQEIRVKLAENGLRTF